MKFIFIGLLMLGTASFCESRVVVVPGSLATAESISGSSFPFDVNEGRMQQLYGASEFGTEAGWIRTIGFRMDVSPNAPTLFTTLSNLQVSISTTLTGSDSLSPVFANNSGLDVALVFSGPFTIRGRQFHNPGEPNPFEIEMSLQTRFFYDPRQGNLLLDIQKFPGGLMTGSATAFDAANTFGDSVSGVFASSANATFGTPSTLGLATRFVIDPVPEPSSALLLLTGLGIFLICRRVRRNAQS